MSKSKLALDKAVGSSIITLMYKRNERLGKITKALGRSKIFPTDFAKAVHDNLETDSLIIEKLTK